MTAILIYLALHSLVSRKWKWQEWPMATCVVGKTLLVSLRLFAYFYSDYVFWLLIIHNYCLYDIAKLSPTVTILGPNVEFNLCENAGIRNAYLQLCVQVRENVRMQAIKFVSLCVPSVVCQR